MLDGIGAVLVLSFLLAISGLGQETLRPARVTAVYLVGFALLSCMGAFGILPSDLLLVQVASPEGQLGSDQLHPWQLLTAFFWTDGLGLGFAFQLWLFCIFSSALERLHYNGSAFKYGLTLSVGAALILLQCVVLRSSMPLALAHPLTFFVVGLASRAEPRRMTRIFGLSLRWDAVPWLLLCCALPIFGVHATTCNTLGICAALFFDAAFGLPPPAKASEATTGGANASSLASAAPSKPRNSASHWQGAQLKPSKPALKSGTGSRERWLHLAQVAAAMLLVLYHGGTKASDRRSDSSVDMAYVRSLRHAMDFNAPTFKQLLHKFSELRPNQAMAADAASIFAAWTFAVEHWGQALAQESAPIKLSALQAIDPSTIRQHVAQGLVRTEIPEEMSDAELVPEALNLMGLGRLVVTPEAFTHVEKAVAAHREHRARTSEAWELIKQFVHRDEPPKDSVSALFSAINLSLSEYDLPGHMTDQAVLAELFGLLELPRDAVSFRTEKLLLDGIDAHRSERRQTSNQLAETLLLKVRAAALNETAASSAPAVASDESSSLAEANRTLHRVLSEALLAMEVSGEANVDEVWDDLLRRLQLNGTESELIASAEGGSTLLRSVFEQISERKAAEARVQQVFEELIATVRAEDPNLAAEEAKKRRRVASHEANRVVWLSKLLGRAQQLGFTIPTPRVEALPANASKVDVFAAVEARYKAAAQGDLAEVQDWGAEFTSEQLMDWVNELATLLAKQSASAGLGESEETENKEVQKHAHYARLLKLPRLIDDTLASWIDPSDDLSDKQIFHELLRMMGLPEQIESRLMRAMIEAVKQHRLRREREAVQGGDWADISSEPIGQRPQMRTARAWPKSAASLVNVGGDGNDFAIFLGAMLRGIGAKIRLTNGCSRNVELSPAALSGAKRESRAFICQLFLEVRMGRQPMRIAQWARSWLAGSRWVGRTYHYRLDQEGYSWLNLDYLDTRRIQRPGAPYKDFETQTIYHPDSLSFEVEGEEVDSNGHPRLAVSPIYSLELGMR